MGIALAVILTRVLRLQRDGDERLARTAERQHFSCLERTARRGSIYDRNSRLLVHSVEAKSVFVDPKGVEDLRPLAQALSDCLELDPEATLAKLEQRRDARFIWIARKIPDEQYTRLYQLLQSQQSREALKGAHIDLESRRVNVFGPLAGQILGFSEEGGDGRGLEATEAAWEFFLHGEHGYQVAKRDVLGRRVILPELPSQAAHPGHGLYLTIDSVIQGIVEAELARAEQQHRPRNAFAVVIDPWSGDILAMASVPSFDPTRFRDYSPEERSERCRNRVVADAYEFGSVVKPFTVAAALNERLVTMDTIFHCGNGSLQIGRRTLRDHHPYGNLPLTDVLVKSSNVGTVKVGQLLGPERLHRYLSQLGFGQLTGVDFPGEATGVLRPLSAWTDYSLPSITIGQEVSATPLQLAMAFCALANGGVLMKPRLLTKVVDHEGQTVREIPVTRVRQVFRPAVVRDQLLPALHQVVERGTGTAAKLKGYDIAGKTGTAQKLVRGSEGLHLSSFIGFGPLPDARILVYVGVNEPKGEQYGGRVAAPFAGAIFQKVFDYLQIEPKVEVASQ
jgi:cell division protein FtsI (penicillin-binding protein 3)